MRYLLIGALQVAALGVGATQAPVLTEVESTRLEVAKLQVEVARLTRELSVCTSARTDLAAGIEVSKFLKSIEEAYPGYVLDAASGKLVAKPEPK
jgi:hypothetical protein